MIQGHHFRFSINISSFLISPWKQILCSHHNSQNSDKALSFSQKILTLFLISPWKHMLLYTLEAPHQGASNEYPQRMFLWRNKKKYYLAILIAHTELWISWSIAILLSFHHNICFHAEIKNIYLNTCLLDGYITHQKTGYFLAFSFWAASSCSWPPGYRTFFMLNSAELFSCSTQLSMKIFMLVISNY